MRHSLASRGIRTGQGKNLSANGVERFDEEGNMVYRLTDDGLEEYWEYTDGRKTHYKNSDGDELWFEYDSNGVIVRITHNELGVTYSAYGIERGQFKEMMEDEKMGAEEYEKMAELDPENRWVWLRIRDDELRHRDYIRRISKGEQIDIRGILKDDLSDMLVSLEKAGRLSSINREKAERYLHRAIDNIEVEELKAEGIEAYLIGGFLSAIGGNFANKVMSGSQEE